MLIFTVNTTAFPFFPPKDIKKKDGSQKLAQICPQYSICVGPKKPQFEWNLCLKMKKGNYEGFRGGIMVFINCAER